MDKIVDFFANESLISVELDEIAVNIDLLKAYAQASGNMSMSGGVANA